jgi:hypothetical protein
LSILTANFPVSIQNLKQTPLQSLTGKYRGLQENPCNENRDPAMRTGVPCNENSDPSMRTGVPCNENRVFPVGIGSQGVPCQPYRVWVYSVVSFKQRNDHSS